MKGNRVLLIAVTVALFVVMPAAAQHHAEHHHDATCHQHPATHEQHHHDAAQPTAVDHTLAAGHQPLGADHGQYAISHHASRILPADSVSTLELAVTSEGTLFLYHKASHGETWCKTEGVNDGDHSHAVMPVYPLGTEVHYFFATEHDRVVTAKSAVHYAHVIPTPSHDAAVSPSPNVPHL